MAKRGIFITVIVVLLVAISVFLGYQYFTVKKQLQENQAKLETQKLNENILSFTQIFIQKVLKAETEVDFETRLQLENKVRDLNDKDILAKWQQFTESKTEAEAQNNCKDLLEILVQKIKV